MNFNQENKVSSSNVNEIDIQTCSFVWLMKNQNTSKEFTFPKGIRFEINANFSYYIMSFCVNLVHPKQLSGYLKGSITLMDKNDKIIDNNDAEAYFDLKNGVSFKRKNWMLAHGEPYETYRLLCEFAITVDKYIEIGKDNLSNKEDSFGSPESININAAIKDFQAMYANKRMTDVMLQTGDKIFHAHKFVLASRSNVFYVMFTQQSLQSSNNIINLSNLDSITLDYLLKFMYGEALEELTYESYKKLLLAANKYIIPLLKEMCSNVLKNMITEENVCELLLLSDVAQDVNLKSDLIKFIITNKNLILRTPPWKQVEERNNKLATEVLKQLGAN